MDREIRRLVKLAEDQGWVVIVGKHVKFLAPGGGMVVSAKTPSDHRSVKNTVAHLRRAGLEIPR